MVDEINTPTKSLALPKLTASANLRLLTPRGASTGLALLGLRWHPRRLADADIDQDESGMYAWCDGHHDPGVDELDRAVLYFGIGRSSKGVLNRLENEQGWLDGAGHAHGIAMSRRLAAPVVGRVDEIPGTSLDWLLELPSRAAVAPDAPDKVAAWLKNGMGGPLEKAEQFAIRFSIHAGDVVSPVNSQFASAWNYDHHGADWAAWCVAMHLRASGASPSEKDASQPSL